MKRCFRSDFLASALLSRLIQTTYLQLASSSDI